MPQVKPRGIHVDIVTKLACSRTNGGSQILVRLLDERIAVTDAGSSCEGNVAYVDMYGTLKYSTRAWKVPK
jgi:hypothetical protein